MLPAAGLNAEAVRGADLVLTRSTVKVGAGLLEGSAARFVATATSGVDHVDEGWLAARGIGFASAHGSNARSVAEWFAAALLTLCERQGRDLRGLRLGVVGVGAVGSQVLDVARALGIGQVLASDPPRERRGERALAPWAPLARLLRESDVVTLHVPLIEEGEDRTRALIDAAALARLPAGAILMNAARGEVVTAEAVLSARRGGVVCALDVWASEPEVDPAHVAAAAVATAHIAGHSLDAKVEGTRMIYEAACAALGEAPRWAPGPEELPEGPEVVLECAGRAWQAAVAAAVAVSYDLARDDAAMRALAALPEGERGRAFRRWRQEYPVRREFAATRLAPRGADAEVAATLRALGFVLA